MNNFSEQPMIFDKKNFEGMHTDEYGYENWNKFLTLYLQGFPSQKENKQQIVTKLRKIL